MGDLTGLEIGLYDADISGIVAEQWRRNTIFRLQWQTYNRPLEAMERERLVISLIVRWSS